MRFNVEKTFLKQVADRPTMAGDHMSTLIETEADDINDALRRVLSRNDAEIVDEVHWLPGSQAVTAVREGANVFMLQLFPVSDELENENEGENDQPFSMVQESRERP